MDGPHAVPSAETERGTVTANKMAVGPPQTIEHRDSRKNINSKELE